MCLMPEVYHIISVGKLWNIYFFAKVSPLYVDESFTSWMLKYILRYYIGDIWKTFTETVALCMRNLYSGKVTKPFQKVCGSAVCENNFSSL